MIIASIFSRLNVTLQNFKSATCGNVTVIFALSIVPVVGAVGAAVDYSQSNSIQAAMQAAADGAALGTIKSASTLTPSAVQSTAVGMFNASFNRPGITPTASASYDSGSSTVTVNATATYDTKFAKLIGVSAMNVSVKSKAMLASISNSSPRRSLE